MGEEQFPLGQHSPKELSVVNLVCVVQYGQHMWLQSTENVANVNEKLNLYL